MNRTTARAAIQLKNIIFATDFSPAASAALPFAGSIAKHFGSNLFAVHARTPENYALPATEVWPIANEQLEKETASLKTELQENYSSIPAEIITVEGGVVTVIDTTAKEKNADLVVLGTNGRRGIGKFFLGSVAEEVLRKAPCPVLTVGPHVGTDVFKPTNFRKILYATDFGEGAPAAVSFITAFAEENDARLVLMHVIEPPKTGDLVRPHELESGALDRLNSFVPRETALLVPPKTIVMHGVPGDKILEVAEKEGADLIVLGVRKAKGYIRATHFPAAVAHQVISRATCPVLTIRS